MTTTPKRKAAQYPRIVGMAKDMTPQWGKHPRFCAYCHDPATHRITLAVNHLPSENETRDVCAIHAVALPEGVTA
jgi:hypothetical protein